LWWSKKEEAKALPTIGEVTNEIKNDTWFINMVEEKAEAKVYNAMSRLVTYFEKAYKAYDSQMASYGHNRDEETRAKTGMVSFGMYVDRKIQDSYNNFVEKEIKAQVKNEVDIVVNELKTYLNSEKMLDDIVNRLKVKQLS
jgi:hypothetical protein